jgi:putative endonuclease
MGSRETGVIGEKIAEKYLRKKGYQILDRNYTFKIPGSPQKGEIDIIARKNNIINFVEVKTLKTEEGQSSLISPEEKVNFRKQRKIIKTAESWLMKRKIPLNSKWRIDIISIEIKAFDKKVKIRHLKNITDY